MKVKVSVEVEVEDKAHCAAACDHREKANGQCNVFNQPVYWDKDAGLWKRCRKCVRNEIAPS